MLKKTLVLGLAAAALAVPAGALAGHGHGGGPKQTTYEFHGTLSVYTAATSLVNGTVTIVVQHANKAGRPFVGQTLTFPVSLVTHVVPGGAAIADGDQGMIQVKGAGGLDATGLQALVPRQLVDETLSTGTD